MKKGVSLISLIITVIVMIILASITIFSSLNTVSQSEIVKAEAELEDVSTFVRSISTLALAGKLKLNLTRDTLATEEQLDLFVTNGDDTEFTSGEKDQIVAKNAALTTDSSAKFGYHYIKGKQIEYDNIPGLESITSGDNMFVIPTTVDNDYIINFYYGTVIARVSTDRTIVRGSIK